MITTGGGFSPLTVTFTVRAKDGAKPVPKISMVSPATAADVPGTAEGSPTVTPFRWTAAANTSLPENKD
jgi:hypothetical protein